MSTKTESKWATKECLDIFRAAEANPQETLKEVQFVIDKLRVSENARLLDVACGRGRHAFALANKGFSVTGVDINPEYIEYARKNSRELAAKLAFINDDMRHIDWNSEFDGGFCLGDSFGYFDFGASESFVSSFAKALKPGTRLLIDTSSVAEVLIPNLQKVQAIQIDGSEVIVKSTYHAESSCLESRYETYVDGKKESSTSLRWIFSAGEITRMLGKAGLLVAGLYGSLTGDPFELGANRMLILAQKR